MSADRSGSIATMPGGFAARALVTASLAFGVVGGCSAVSGLSGYTFDGTDAANGGASQGGGGNGGGVGGNGAECDHVADCNPRECIEASCIAHRCVIGASAVGATCSSGVCDGHGSCVGCVNAGDCPATPDCVAAVCASRACTIEFAAPKTACTNPKNGVCDGKGKCVECVDNSTCSDGLSCSHNSCCNMPCTGSCEVCMPVDGFGFCMPLDVNSTNPGLCDATHGGCGNNTSAACACDGDGKCLEANGETCTHDAECASRHCGTNGVCQ
jgi:hypothetical protein